MIWLVFKSQQLKEKVEKLLNASFLTGQTNVLAEGVSGPKMESVLSGKKKLKKTSLNFKEEYSTKLVFKLVNFIYKYFNLHLLLGLK